MRVGLDIGSTTIKCVVLDEHDALLYSTYERHYSHILEKAQELLRRIDAEQLHGQKALLSISGSAGMGLADSCGVPFVQEHFEIIVLGIVAISVAPAFIGAVKAAISSRKSGKRDFEVEAVVDAERIARAKHARSEEEAR